MTDGFDVFPGKISSQAQVFADVGADLSGALKELQSSLAALGDVSGGDDPGRKFASKYDPNTSVVTANAAKLVEAALGMSDGLSAAARDYTATDAANSDLMRPKGGSG